MQIDLNPRQVHLIKAALAIAIEAIDRVPEGMDYIPPRSDQKGMKALFDSLTDDDRLADVHIEEAKRIVSSFEER